MPSAKSRLTLGYLGIIAAVLGSFSLLFYLSAAVSLSRDLDKTLALQADGVAETVFAFWRAERGTTGSGPGNWLTAPAETLERSLDEGGLSALLSRWAEKTGNFNTERPIRLLDEAGQTLGVSAGFAHLERPDSSAAIAKARHGETVYETLAQPDGRVRLVTRPVLSAHHVLYVVQVAASLRDMEASLAKLRILLALFSLVMLAATSVMGLILASRVFEPIRRLIAQSQRFIAESLHERMEVSTSSDEVGQLDTTFNEMLVRLERAFRRLWQFSAAASHELRTPLTVMKGEIGVALRKPRSAEEYRRILRTQLEAIDEMANTVEELLRLVQRVATEGELEWEAVDLSALTQRMCATFKTIAGAKAIRIDTVVNGAVWVSGERWLLERLLANLLDNAIRHTPSNSTVTVSTRGHADEASLTVHDTGPGIPLDEVPRLFDQFFIRRPDADPAQSTGLGLGLCRWIVETHHGHFDVASTPGQGTTFVVHLPIAAPPA